MKFATTLYDVVIVVQDLARSDREVVAVLWHMLRGGRIRFVRSRPQPAKALGRNKETC